VWADIVMKRHNTPTKHATSLVQDRTTPFHALIVEHRCKNSTSRTPFLSQNPVHMNLRVEMVFIGDEVCLLSMDCCFDSGVTYDTHVSSPVTRRLKKSSLCSLYRIRKVNALACRFIFCSSVSTFGTQREHSFRKRSLPDKFLCFQVLVF
jgi:hypothetical protein